MKPIVLIFAALSLGLLALLLTGSYLWFAPASLQEQAGLQPASRVAAAPSEDQAHAMQALEAQVLMVSERVAQLEAQLDELSRASARRPAEVEVAASTAPAPVAAGLGITPADREAVVEILASVRAEEQAARDEERRLRDEERVAERAAEIAKELGLSLADQHTLGEHMLTAASKRSELMAGMREDGFDPATMRDSFMELREWNDEQLETLFGAGLAEQIQGLERQSRGFGRGGGGGGRGPEGDGGGGRRSQPGG